VEALDALYARTRAQVNLAQAIFDYQVAADQLRRSLGLDVVDTGAASAS
jgi:hypothetical protein